MVKAVSPLRYMHKNVLGHGFWGLFFLFAPVVALFMVEKYHLSGFDGALRYGGIVLMVQFMGGLYWAAWGLTCLTQNAKANAKAMNNLHFFVGLAKLIGAVATLTRYFLNKSVATNVGWKQEHFLGLVALLMVLPALYHLSQVNFKRVSCKAPVGDVYNGHFFTGSIWFFMSLILLAVPEQFIDISGLDDAMGGVGTHAYNVVLDLLTHWMPVIVLTNFGLILSNAGTNDLHLVYAYNQAQIRLHMMTSAFNLALANLFFLGLRAGSGNFETAAFVLLGLSALWFVACFVHNASVTNRYHLLTPDVIEPLNVRAGAVKVSRKKLRMRVA